MEWSVIYTDNSNVYYATPTAEETEVLNDLEAAFTAKSQELFYDLMTGARSISEWDSIIAELNAAGMSEIRAVYQARASRFFNGL